MMKKIFSVAVLSGLVLFAEQSQAMMGSFDPVVQQYQGELSETRKDVAKLEADVQLLKTTPAPAPVPVEDNNSMYVSLGGAYLFDTDSDIVQRDVNTNNEWMATGAVGIDFGTLRSEIEYGYQNIGVENGAGDCVIHSGMMNVYADFPIMERVSAYGQLGLGVGVLDVDGGVIADNTTSFMASAGVGLEFDIYKNTKLQTGYRYMTMADTTVNGVPFSYDTGMIHSSLAFAF